MYMIDSSMTKLIKIGHIKSGRDHIVIYFYLEVICERNKIIS